MWKQKYKFKFPSGLLKYINICRIFIMFVLILIYYMSINPAWGVPKTPSLKPTPVILSRSAYFARWAPSKSRWLNSNLFRDTGKNYNASEGGERDLQGSEADLQCHFKIRIKSTIVSVRPRLDGWQQRLILSERLKLQLQSWPASVVGKCANIPSMECQWWTQS